MMCVFMWQVILETREMTDGVCVKCSALMPSLQPASLPLFLPLSAWQSFPPTLGWAPLSTTPQLSSWWPLCRHHRSLPLSLPWRHRSSPRHSFRHHWPRQRGKEKNGDAMVEIAEVVQKIPNKTEKLMEERYTHIGLEEDESKE